MGIFFIVQKEKELDMPFLNIQNLQDQFWPTQGAALSSPAVPRQKKNYKDCKSFDFQATQPADITKILTYFKDRDTDLLCKMPERLLRSAK